MLWLTNNEETKCLAFMPRCASTAFGKAFIDAFYPERLDRIKKIKTKNGKPFQGYQLICKLTPFPKDGAIKCAMIRDPIERFMSGFARVKKLRDMGVDHAIRLLADRPARANQHIASQALMLRGPALSVPSDIELFRFPDGINACAARLGITMPARINESPEGAKPVLTAAQVDRLREVFAEDMDLFAQARSS